MTKKTFLQIVLAGALALAVVAHPVRVSTQTATDLEAKVDGVFGEALVLKRRPETTIKLTPIYPDAFNGSLGTVVFRRDATGRVTEFSVAQDRGWDLRFKKQTVQGQ